jgi:hypothetical protein
MDAPIDLQNKNRPSPELEKRSLEIELMKDQLVYDKIEIKRREAEIEMYSFDLQLSQLKERMEMKKKQIAYLEGKKTG